MNIITPTIETHAEEIFYLYKRVSNLSGGIIRTAGEITMDYINDFITQSTKNGLILTIAHPELKNQVIAEIHAYSTSLNAFRHILTDLTIVVDPEFQGQGIGKLLFQQFLDIVKTNYPHILRVELFVRENNKSAIAFYTSLGFKKEGVHTNKIKNLDNSLETPIQMTWFNPKYDNAL